VAQRAAQFEARRHLTLLDSVGAAIRAAIVGTKIDAERDKLEALAYPSSGKPPDPFIPNAFAEPDDG
jgi:hypothetical protein